MTEIIDYFTDSLAMTVVLASILGTLTVYLGCFTLEKLLKTFDLKQTNKKDHKTLYTVFYYYLLTLALFPFILIEGVIVAILLYGILELTLPFSTFIVFVLILYTLMLSVSLKYYKSIIERPVTRALNAFKLYQHTYPTGPLEHREEDKQQKSRISVKNLMLSLVLGVHLYGFISGLLALFIR